MLMKPHGRTGIVYSPSFQTSRGVLTLEDKGVVKKGAVLGVPGSCKVFWSLHME